MELAEPCDTIIVTGDFNMPDVDWNFLVNDENSCMIPSNASTEKSKYFIDAFASLSLCQVSYVKNFKNRTLDLVLTDSPNEIQFEDCDNHLVKIDDYHPPLQFCITFTMPNFALKTEICKFNFKQCDFISINQHLQQLDWSEVMRVSDLNIALDNFYNIMCDSLKKFVPTHKYIPEKNCSWFSPTLKKMKNRKNYLHKKFKKNIRFIKI